MNIFDFYNGPNIIILLRSTSLSCFSCRNLQKEKKNIPLTKECSETSTTCACDVNCVKPGPVICNKFIYTILFLQRDQIMGFTWFHKMLHCATLFCTPQKTPWKALVPL